MRTSRSLFHVARVLLGTSHLVLQTAADLCVLAEVEVVKRTGFETQRVLPDGTVVVKMERFGDSPYFTERNYKIGRCLETRKTQRKAVMTLEQARAKVSELRASGKIKNNLNVA